MKNYLCIKKLHAFSRVLMLVGCSFLVKMAAPKVNEGIDEPDSPEAVF